MFVQESFDFVVFIVVDGVDKEEYDIFVIYIRG